MIRDVIGNVGICEHIDGTEEISIAGTVVPSMAHGAFGNLKWDLLARIIGPSGKRLRTYLARADPNGYYNLRIPFVYRDCLVSIICLDAFDQRSRGINLNLRRYYTNRIKAHPIQMAR